MKYTDDVIFNMDENPLALNMPPNYTIAHKGKKTVIIRTQSQEKCRVSFLGIIADGNTSTINYFYCIMTYNSYMICIFSI